MAFVDELKLNIRAGNGGNGVVRWRHEKGKEFSGPSGGNGGRGGDIYIEGSRDINLLFKYRHIKNFSAEDGQDGGSNSCTGKNGQDLIILLPIGSVITNQENDFVFELLTEGQKIKILNGGSGGLGNEYFKSSTNINPQEATLGKKGEMADFMIELRIIADAGLIGLPNAGKSSLLNALTRANVKVGNYEFTTLDPNVGAFYEFVLADIPGLIEGASEGKGLGHKFLRHIQRTKFLIHCVSAENENPLMAYQTVRQEIEKFDISLASKEEIVLITKTDTVDSQKVSEILQAFSSLGKKNFAVSLMDGLDLKKISDALIQILRAKN